MASQYLWAILFAMVFSVPLGFIWYGPLFGKTWMRLSGISMPSGKPSMGLMLKPMLLSLIGAAFMVLALASATQFHNAYWNVSGYAASFSFAFFLWLGFIVPPYLNISGWEGRSWKLFCINTGYWLVYLLVASNILTYAGL